MYTPYFFHGFHHNPEINTTWYAEIIETLVNIFGREDYHLLLRIC